MPSQMTVKARVTAGMSSAGAMRPSSFSCWNSFRKLSLMKLSKRWKISATRGLRVELQADLDAHQALVAPAG